MKTVLYVCQAYDNLGGAAYSLLYMIKALDNCIKPIVLLQGHGPVSDLYEKNGIECIFSDFPYNVRNNRNLIHYSTYFIKKLYINRKKAKSIKEVRRLLCDRHIDIVHSNASNFDFGYDLARKLGTKHVWHIREFLDLDFNITPFGGWSELYSKIYSSDATIAITKAIYRHWHLEKSQKSYWIWNAVRSIDECCFLDKKEQYFLFCAAILGKKKGIESAIRSFSLSNLSKLGYKLKIIGNFPSNEYKRYIEKLVNKLNLCNSIEFLGYIKDIKPLMSKSAAFLMTSENEGMGRVTVEAMFYGCPVIARKSGGSLEFICDEINGYFFETDEECAKIMNQVITTDCSQIINAAQKVAAQDFSIENYRNKIMNIYNSI